MLKSRLLVGVLVAVFAVATATDVAFAAKTTKTTKTTSKTTPASAAAQKGTSGHPPACAKGTVAKWHTVSGKKQWHCVKA